MDEALSATPLAELTLDKERERSRLLLAQFYGATDDGTENVAPVSNSQVFDSSSIGRLWMMIVIYHND